MIGAARSPVRGTRPSARAAHTRHTLHVADSRRTASVGARRGQARPRQGSSSAGSARRRRRVFGPSGEPRRHRLERRRAAHAHGGAAAQASDGSIRHVRRFSDLGFQLGQVAHRGSIQVRARRWQRQSLGSDVELLARWDAALTQTAKASQRSGPSQEWRLAPCGSADTRCANLRAIFDSVVLALSTNFGTNRNRLGLGTQLSPALPPSILKV